MIVEGKKWQIEEDLGNTTEADIMLIPDIYLTDVSYGEIKKKDAEGWKPNPLIY